MLIWPNCSRMSAQTQTQPTATSIDPAEVEQFSRIADAWWDAKGKFKPLHDINPLRIGYIRDQVVTHLGGDAKSLKPLAGLSLLDIGCGGGLICEPMCRMGAQVTGIDASEKNIAVAALHAEQSGLAVDYRATTAEALVQQNAHFDVVLALEIVEHVVDADAFIASCAALVKPGGMLIMTTLNRTPKSYAMAIIGAEYVLRLLPRGTHQWKKFVRPSEMARAMQQSGLNIADMSGMVLNPLRREWKLSATDLDVNYLMVARKSTL